MTVAALSGSELPWPIVSTSNQVEVLFTSGQNVRFAGFVAMFVVSPCPFNCSGAGDCMDGICYCNMTTYGDGCQFSTCASNCSGNGVCDSVSKTCQCQAGYSGDDCSVSTIVPYWLFTSLSPVPVVASPFCKVPGQDLVRNFFFFLFFFFFFFFSPFIHFTSFHFLRRLSPLAASRTVTPLVGSSGEI